MHNSVPWQKITLISGTTKLRRLHDAPVAFCHGCCRVDSAFMPGASDVAELMKTSLPSARNDAELVDMTADVVP